MEDIEVYLRVNELLKEKNKTKYWLVKQLDSSYAVVNNLVSGDAVAIQLRTVGKLCKIFDCSPDDLFDIH